MGEAGNVGGRRWSKFDMFFGGAVVVLALACFGWFNHDARIREQQIIAEFQKQYPNRAVKLVISGEGWSDYVEYHITFTEPPGSEEHKTMWAMSYKNDKWTISYKSEGSQ